MQSCRRRAGQSTCKGLTKRSTSLQAQALPYWQQAGQRANARSAHVEAEAHLSKGLEVLATLPATPERAQHELALHLDLGPALMAIRGHHTEEVERVYTRARELCQQVGETSQLFAALGGLHRFYYVQGALHTARELGEQFLALAKRQEDSTLLLAGHWMMGTPLVWLGEVARAHAHFEQTIARFNLQQHRGLVLRYGLDPGSASRVFTAFTLWTTEYADQALRRSQEALLLAQELAQPLNQAYVLFLVAMFHWLRRDAQSTCEYVEACMSLATEHGFPLWITAGTWLHGAALAQQGYLDEGIAQLRQGRDALRATRTELLGPMILIALAEAHAKAGRPDGGHELLVDAQDVVARTAQHFWEAEVYRLQGEYLLAQSAAHASETEACFHHALDITRRQQAKAWELRAATSLARLWQSQGKRQEAYDLLTPVYGWFTEGLDTTDLQEAKALLNELKE